MTTSNRLISFSGVGAGIALPELCQDPELLKLYVFEKWLATAIVFESLESSVRKLERMIDRLNYPSTPSTSEVLSKSLDTIFNRLLMQWSAEHNGITAKVLTTRSFEGPVNPFNSLGGKLSALGLSEASLRPTDFVRQRIDSINFPVIVAMLAVKLPELEVSGLAEAAATVKKILFPGGIGTPHLKGKLYEIKLTITHAHGSYKTSDVEDLNKLYRALEIIGLESNTESLASDMQQIFSLFAEAGYENKIPAKTVINKDKAISGYVYKDSVGIRMSQETLENIISFIKRYHAQSLQIPATGIYWGYYFLEKRDESFRA